MAEWPPTLEAFKADRKVTDDRDDVPLAADLAAAIAYVERVRGSDFNFSGDEESGVPEPTDDLVRGTLMYAARLFQRRKSPDGVVFQGDLGTGTVPGFDSDIEKLLGVGRFAPIRFA